jgi:hypothetical protein
MSNSYVGAPAWHREKEMDMTEQMYDAYRDEEIERLRDECPTLTQAEVVLALRFLTEPERLQLHGHEARGHVGLVDKLVEIAKHLGVTIHES